MTKLLIAGGGMGGLATAIAAARAGWQPHLFEQAAAFGEAGAGIQLGPNATRRLQAWGLGPQLERVGAFPGHLRVRRAHDGGQLASMPLGSEFARRYGAPYVTLHRADLQDMLRVQALAAGAQLNLGLRVTFVSETEEAVSLRTDALEPVEGAALVGADGLWSKVRTQAWPEAASPFPTGHVAYRTLLPQQDLPASLRSADVTVWLGPRLHMVTYPVRQGSWLNAVAIVQDAAPDSPRDWDWDLPARGADLLKALEGADACAALKDLAAAAAEWRLWVLHELAPLSDAMDMARGRVALLGDAAHPMRPYFAQGAGMAIEDADELGHSLGQAHYGAQGVPEALLRYADARWRRNARVQRRSARNGRIFHATGPLRWARDLALRTLGQRLLDASWLYR
jgi:salicylate hydroxylase